MPNLAPPDRALLALASENVEAAAVCESKPETCAAMPTAKDLKPADYAGRTASSRCYDNPVLADAHARQAPYRSATRKGFSLWEWLTRDEWMVDGNQPDEPAVNAGAERASRDCDRQKSPQR